MSMVSPHIVIIHDDWNENYPLVLELREKYGDDNVKFLKHSQAGIDYLMQAPTQKTIVVLDYNFKTGEPTGGDVFKKIRQKSSLVYVIIVTKSRPKDISPDDFIEFVNNHALAIAQPSGDYTEISRLVEIAIQQLEMRADVILEEWIVEKSAEDREKPFMALADKRIYTLNEILENIRQKTPLGDEITKDILGLAIDLVLKKMNTGNA
jgi:hypothetical protein